MLIISHLMPKLIKNSVLVLGLLPLVVLGQAWASGQFMLNQEKQRISLRVSLTKEQHTKGLSGVRPQDMRLDEGMLFVNDSMGRRQFWMPDTYFNLDIIFLNSALVIVGIERNVPAHPGTSEPPAIQRTKTYEAQYVLETKAGSPFSANLKVGNRLKWIKN